MKSDYSCSTKSSIKHIRRRDCLLVTALLLIALLIGVIARVRNYGISGGHEARISVDGEVTETLDLSLDQELTVRGADGAYNHLIVEDGSIRCDDASCPDKICIDMGSQSGPGAMIVCLPNKVIVTVQ